MNYVLITPARDEETTIEQTIQSVVKQTVTPLEWIIVSDGSTDRTEEIVSATTSTYSWIRLLKLKERSERSFGAVVHAMNAGFRALKSKKYDYIGLLDADVRFSSDYFEKLLKRFDELPNLGLAGGVVIDPGIPKNHFPRNRIDVPGAAQFFRYRCFEEIGGLIAVPEGGWDALTCAQARMRGYQTRLFTDLVIEHLKPRNIALGGKLKRQWVMGIRDYVLGYYPLFEIAKCFSKIIESPPLISSTAWFFGYCFAFIQRRERIIPDDLFEFIRSEQKDRLFKSIL